MDLTIVNLIQAMLAPGIMISACALLMLGMNNKYSLIVNRIRALDEEERKLNSEQKKSGLNDDQEKRLKSIMMQTGKLAYRLKLVRNAVIFYSIAIALFISSSLFIGLHYITETKVITVLAACFFLTGMVSVLVGVLHVSKEVRKGFEIVMIEINQ